MRTQRQAERLISRWKNLTPDTILNRVKKLKNFYIRECYYNSEHTLFEDFPVYRMYKITLRTKSRGSYFILIYYHIP